jgi:hypothetical protein
VSLDEVGRLLRLGSGEREVRGEVAGDARHDDDDRREGGDPR